MENIQNTSCGRMFPEHSHQTRETISDASLSQYARLSMKPYLSLNLRNGNQQDKLWETITPLPGESSMLNTGVSHKEENASSLSQILQTGVPEKYYLSQKACLGILKRASNRGKVLPTVLKQALERQVQMMANQ